MRTTFLIPACFICIAGYANSEKVDDKFITTLPNGVSIELIGIAYHRIDKGPKLWWGPDGEVLLNEPYRRPNMYSTGSATFSIREIAVHITGAGDYSTTAFSSFGRSETDPGIPKDVNDTPLPELRSFICKFGLDQKEDTIRFGISTEPWQKVEDWEQYWPRLAPEDIVFDSDNSLIFTCPRKGKRGEIIVEITHRYVNEATRLLMYDIDDNIQERRDSRHISEGDGLIKNLHQFWGTPLENIRKFEFQKRPYQWIEFRNVSLEPDHKTNVEIDILSTKDKLSRGFAVSEHEKESLGYILDRLTNNLKFPLKGRAIYKLEELHAPTLGQEPRVLECKYSFDGVYYRFETVTIEPGTTLETLDIRRYFDGDKTTMMFRDNAADIWKGKREKTPIYRLQRFCPGEVIEELLNHEVELKGSCEINGVLCSLLNCIISSKDRLKVWVAKEPDIYPLRVERYEYDNMRYLYQAENIKYWNGFLCPEKITTQWYRSDETVKHIPLSSYVVTVESFSPNIELAADEFAPEFAPDASVSTHALAEPQASDFKPTIPAKHLQKFADIDIEFDMEQAQDKIMLVCFFDTNQRPSRNCILQLSKKAQELNAKDIVVVAIQASKLDKKKLNDWVKDNSIPFSVGLIQADEEKIRFNWGVRSLPWLILTDKEHVVEAEGFNVNELDGKIKAITEK